MGPSSRMFISEKERVGLLKQMAESISNRHTQAEMVVQPRSQEESFVICGYQEGCLEAATMP